MLSALNNSSSLVAENALSSTQAGLQKTLNELSTGLRINSGADDAASLSIADSIHANIAQLTQSCQNTVETIGQLQTLDGARAKVGTLLNRAVTLATEASNGGLTGDQTSAINSEYYSVLVEITQIYTSTSFNGLNLFSANETNEFISSQGSLTAASSLTQGAEVTVQDSSTGGTFRFVAGAGDTVADLQSAIGNATSGGTLSAGTTASLVNGSLVISTITPGAALEVTNNDPALGDFQGTNNVGPYVVLDLVNNADATAALSSIYNAISYNSLARGQIGAEVNRLTAEENVDSGMVLNLTSASNNIEDADIGKILGQLTQLTVLQQTGMAALSQTNHAQKALLQLIQGLQ